MSNEKAPKPIAIVKRGSLDKSGKETLRRGGYIVIESDDLECLRLSIGGAVAINANTVFHAAMSAISETSSLQSPRDQFGARLARALADETKPKGA